MHLVNARSLLVAALLLLTTQAAFIDDKTALTRLYEVSDGPRWTNHTNWGVTDNVCSWFGIACFSEKVISINLPNNNLVGRVSKFIYQMETLEQVRLKDNKLQSGSFEIFPGGDTSGEDVTISPLLKVLDFAGNALTDVTGVGNAPDTLEELHFTSNSIQGDFPVEITLLTKLKLLYLSFNKIAGTLPTEIGRMTGLQQFYSYGNLLTGQVPTEIGNLDKIEVFTLSENKLSGTIPTQVNAMFNLRIFSIHNNDPKTGKLSGKVPTFEKAPYLNEVYFDGNALTGSIPTELLLNSNITNNLVTIGLSNNLLVGSIPTSLLKFDSLFLDVTGNLLDVPLDAEFCTKGAWMNGLVEEHGCDAILCPAGQYVSQQGRATDEANCTSCTTNTGTLGATACDGLVLDDWFVLAIMYRDLGGSGWNKTDGWNLLESILDNGMVDNIDLTLINVCEWHGIICDNTKKVTEINLQNNGLIGTIPTELFQMPALSILDLSKNALDMDGFAALGASQSLLSLKLAGTKIRSVAGIEVAKSLRSLYLDGLDLGGKFPTQLYALTDLHLLHLQFTGLTGTLHTELGRMNKLRQLNLYNNELTGPLPTELGTMTDMNFFEVSENAFTDKLPTQLDLMVKLEKFHIHQAGGGLTGTLPAFNNFPLLTELSLDNNKFSGPIPPTFLQGISDTAKQSAHILASLTHNDLTDVVPKELSNFADLDIRLEGNKISGIAPELCEKGEWMNGQVEKLGNSCDAILCPANTFNVYGKKSVGEFSECADCPSAQFYGSVFCDDDNPNPEKTILDKLYKATGGRYWKRSANWTEPGVPICFREGIICDGETDAGVIEIEMLDNELNGVIPADVFDLPKVRLLGFTNNDVDISFSKIADASALIVLKMSNTKVRSLDGIDKAPAALTEMHLAGNQLTGSIPSAVYKLNTVEKLFLNNNLFTGSITDKVKDMTNLQQLYLGGNKLTGHIPPELGSLQKLEQIDLEANFLSGNLPTELEQLPLLINLLLRGQKSDKKLSGSLLSFTGSDRISTIDLSNNDFAGTIPNDFLSNVPSERAVTVNLASNRISGTLPIALKALSSLNIDLANNEVVRLFDDSCDVNPAWMDGAIAAFPTCDAILCGPGTHAPKGKQVSAAEPCVQCPDNLVDAPFFGATSCKSHINGFTEQNVLEELYARTNGTNWITRTNWVSDKSVCSWYGVTCRDDGVTELKLDSNGLETSDDVSSLIFSLPNLEKLDIKGNKVTLDLTKLPNGNKLQILMLSATGLKSIAGITKASDMRRLHITDNDLTGTFPEDIFELTQLRSLYLSFNMFTGPLPTKLSALTNLEEFYVFGNRIEGSIPSAAIAPLTNIREFIMANNFLTGKIPDVFNNLPALEQLSLFGQLSDSLLTGTLPNFLGAPTMWYFDISGNDLTGTIPKDFMKNSKWHDSDVTVYLSNNELTGAVPTELNAFTSLDLSIIGNSITGLPSVLCGADNANWMQGQLGTIGSCDAIACPPGTFNLQGRQDATSNPCQSCPASAGDNRFGQTHCEDISTEKATLEALYSATGGTNWSGQSKWISSEPICSWEGILCENGNVDDDSGVTGIDLEEHNLDGTIPKSVWKLPFLTSFNVKHNEDLYITFDGLSAASALELLYLSEVNIDTLEGISKASSLRQLHITGCGVSGPFPNELFELGATLDGLFMAYNSMTGTLSTRFGELSNLESFYAFDNEFSGKIPTQIGMMSKLHRVVLAENLLSGPIPSEVSNLHNLQLFSAFRIEKPGNKLSGPLPSFNQNPLLTDLYLTNNDITGEIPDDFLSASKDAGLIVLSFNRIEGVVPESLGALSSMNLELEGNMISDFAPILCNNSLWMSGDVGRVGCSAFLCPVATSTIIGRANATLACTACSDSSAAPYYGSTTCESVADERAILVKFFSDCGGTLWYNKDKWASSEPHCNWYGVTCEGGNFGRVISLNLGANNVIGYPPKEIFDLPELETLELFANPLTGLRFGNIGSAKSLSTLRLDSTGIASLAEIGAAPALTFLDVRFNSLEGAFPEGVEELSHLRYLNLGNNKLSGPLPLGYFSKLYYLKTLRLGSNEFTGNVPAFHVNTGLTTIDLSDNMLSGTIPDNFLEVKTITVPIEINLSGNQITGTVPTQLQRFSDVTIYLRDNQIDTLPSDLCNGKVWNGGDVGQYGCNAIMCPPGTFNFAGRARDDEQCQACLDGNQFFGQTSCENPGSSAAMMRMYLSAISALFLAALLL